MQILSITVFALACATMFYVLFGYPLLLGWMARRATNPVHKDEKLRTVSFVIAVYNGEKFLERKLKTILSLNYPRELIDILVVSDGSTDRTDEIARSFASQGVRFLRVPHGGKAAALNAAVPLVSGEILVLNDVRQTLDPDCLRKIIACFGDPKVGSVSPRTIIVEGDSHEEATTSAYWRYEDWIRQRLTRIDSTFGYSGAFAAMRRSLWTPLPPGTLLDDVYVPLKAFFQGYRILYEPTATMYDFPTVLHSEFRRKVRLQAGLYQMLKLMPELLSSPEPDAIPFLVGQVRAHRHPVLHDRDCPGDHRPAALLASLAAWGQVVFYGLAALDPLVPDRFPLKKLTSPIRTFVVLMAASLAAVRVYFVALRACGRKRHTGVRRVSRFPGQQNPRSLRCRPALAAESKPSPTLLRSACFSVPRQRHKEVAADRLDRRRGLGKLREDLLQLLFGVEEQVAALLVAHAALPSEEPARYRKREERLVLRQRQDLGNHFLRIGHVVHEAHHDDVVKELLRSILVEIGDHELAPIADADLLGMLRRELQHAFGEVDSDDASSAPLGKGNRVVPRPASDIEHTLAFDWIAALNGLLEAQPHALAEETIDDAIDQPILIAVDCVEVVGVLVEEGLRAIKRHEYLPVGDNCLGRS